MIAVVVDRTDVTGLRLVCKQLHANSLRRFIREFIEDIPIMICNKSFQALTDIATHPVFALCVRRITISTRFIHDDATCQCKVCLAPSSFDATINETLDTDNVEMGENWCPHRSVNPRAAEQEAPKSPRKAPRILTQALRDLGKHNNPLSLYVTDRFPQAIGFRSFWEDIDCLDNVAEETLIWYTNRVFVLDVLLDAISTSAVPLDELDLALGQLPEDWLEIGVYRDRVEASTLVLELLDALKASAVCSRLQRISFEYLHDFKDMDPVTFFTVAAPFHLSTHVESVCFGYDSLVYISEIWEAWEARSHFHGFQWSLASTYLSRLRLVRVLADETELIDILKENASTLKHLYLEDCGLAAGGSWSRLLDWVRENMFLETIKIAGMIVGPPEQDQDDGLFPRITCVSPRILSAQGSIGVRECLEKEVAILTRTSRKRSRMTDIQNF